MKDYNRWAQVRLASAEKSKAIRFLLLVAELLHCTPICHHGHQALPLAGDRGYKLQSNTGRRIPMN
jgi:hypothetical protein